MNLELQKEAEDLLKKVYELPEGKELWSSVDWIGKASPEEAKHALDRAGKKYRGSGRRLFLLEEKTDEREEITKLKIALRATQETTFEVLVSTNLEEAPGGVHFIRYPHKESTEHQIEEETTHSMCEQFTKFVLSGREYERFELIVRRK